MKVSLALTLHVFSTECSSLSLLLLVLFYALHTSLAVFLVKFCHVFVRNKLWYPKLCFCHVIACVMAESEGTRESQRFKRCFLWRLRSCIISFPHPFLHSFCCIYEGRSLPLHQNSKVMVRVEGYISIF